jgi:L-asparagine transporter-like permease
VLVVKYELELLAAVIGSAIVSIVYAAFMLAGIRLRKSQPNTRRSFRSPIPLWVQWAIIVLMPLMGIVTLFSQVGMQYQPLVGMIIFTVVATIMARWSLMRTANQQLRRQN